MLGICYLWLMVASPLPQSQLYGTSFNNFTEAQMSVRFVSVNLIVFLGHMSQASYLFLQTHMNQTVHFAG